MASDAAGQPAFGRKTPEELGVRLFEPAPEGFDPVEASASELRQYGYPARPDAGADPGRYQRWRQMVESTSIIAPEFAVLPIPPVGPINPGPVPFPAQGTSANWAGVVAYPQPSAPPYDDPVTLVEGEWTVPDISAPAPANNPGAWVCATWIGIDGWMGDNPAPVPLLQAGATHIVYNYYAWIQNYPGGFPTLEWFSERQTFAWFEWVPAYPDPDKKYPARVITNVAVSPGDGIWCQIETDSPTGATQADVHLTNQTTGVGTVLTVTAPPDTAVLGNTAEWIVELPQDSYNGWPYQLGRYDSVYFDNCRVQSRSGTAFAANQGELVTLLDATGHRISEPSAMTDHLIKVKWTLPFFP
jgi:hypothetical protein